MKLKMLLMSAAVALTACAGAAASDGGYTLTLPLSPEDDATVFIVNYDNGAKIDSVTVEDGRAVFKGSVDEPVMARLTMDGQRMGTFILENGDLTMVPQKGISSPLNDKLTAIQPSCSNTVRSPTIPPLWHVAPNWRSSTTILWRRPSWRMPGTLSATISS